MIVLDVRVLRDAWVPLITPIVGIRTMDPTIPTTGCPGYTGWLGSSECMDCEGQVGL